MKYILAIGILSISACASQVSEVRMQEKHAEDRFRHEVYLHEEFLADCLEYEMEDCY